MHQSRKKTSPNLTHFEPSTLFVTDDTVRLRVFYGKIAQRRSEYILNIVLDSIMICGLRLIAMNGFLER